MMIKVVILFLCVMAFIGMVGRALFPNSMPRIGKTKPPVCAKCGRYVVGCGPCGCKG